MRRAEVQFHPFFFFFSSFFFLAAAAAAVASLPSRSPFAFFSVSFMRHTQLQLLHAHRFVS